MYGVIGYSDIFSNHSIWYRKIIRRPTAVRNIPTYDVLAVNGLEAINGKAMETLETIGIEFRDDPATKS